MVKCQWCKEQGEKNEMHVEAKDTGELLKSGKPKLIRKYYHFKCLDAWEEDKKFKEIELAQFDELYSYIKELHHMETLTGRMIEKIQDLRNGSIKVKNRKITKYKKGVSYKFMLETYKYSHDSIMNTIDRMKFEEKWNEFSYCFAIMTGNLDEFADFYRRKEKHAVVESTRKHEPVIIDVEPVVNKVKKDKLDISEWL